MDTLSLSELAVELVGATRPWAFFAAAIAAAIGLVTTSLAGNSLGRSGAAAVATGESAYTAWIGLFLLATRWPTLAFGDLEGDESILVSAALTRLVEPGFGLTLFTGSAGPLVTYPLAVLGLLPIVVDYAAAKLLTLVLQFATLAVFYATLRNLASPLPARLAMLPLMAAYGLLQNDDWTMMYCSEQWLNLLGAVGLLACARLYSGRSSVTGNAALFGVAIGLMPLVKWQGLPIGAALTLIFGGCGWLRLATHRERGRQLALVTVTAMAPLTTWTAIQWLVGNLSFFFDTYVVALLRQTNTRFPTTILERLVAMPDWAVFPYPQRYFFLSAAALFVISTLLALRPRARGHRPLLAAALLFAGSFVYAALKPGGPFSHYINLLLLPSATLGAAAMLLAWGQLAALPRRVLITAYLVTTVAVPVIQYQASAAIIHRAPREVGTSFFFYPDPDVAHTSPAPPLTGQPYAIVGSSHPVVVLLRNVARGERVQLWGWDAYYYVLSGTIWGGRTGSSHEILEDFFGSRDMFVARYVEGLRHPATAVFLDTATAGAMIYQNRRFFGHELWPPIAAAVEQHYFLCDSVRGARVYLRRGRFDGTQLANCTYR